MTICAQHRSTCTYRKDASQSFNVNPDKPRSSAHGHACEGDQTSLSSIKTNHHAIVQSYCLVPSTRHWASPAVAAAAVEVLAEGLTGPADPYVQSEFQ